MSNGPLEEVGGDGEARVGATGDARFASVCVVSPCRKKYQQPAANAAVAAIGLRTAAPSCRTNVPCRKICLAPLAWCHGARPGMRLGELLTHDVNRTAGADEVSSSERLLQNERDVSGLVQLAMVLAVEAAKQYIVQRRDPKQEPGEIVKRGFRRVWRTRQR